MEHLLGAPALPVPKHVSCHCLPDEGVADIACVSSSGAL